jgi:hypothetical protein
MKSAKGQTRSATNVSDVEKANEFATAETLFQRLKTVKKPVDLTKFVVLAKHLTFRIPVNGKICKKKCTICCITVCVDTAQYNSSRGYFVQPY